LRFEDELVEAAASSPRGTYDIEKLPQHLQVLARQRRAERLRQRRDERLRAERLRAADEAGNERDS
jgi:hypothetical protein